MSLPEKCNVTSRLAEEDSTQKEGPYICGRRVGQFLEEGGRLE
jgi:hypothetical protein